MGANGLLVLPYFYGERHPLNDPLARGVVAGLTLSHTRGDLYRAVLEAVGYGIRHNIETISGLGIPPQRCLAVGGGAQNLHGLQMVSSITGFEQWVPEQTIGASYGDAFLAGVGLGWFEHIEDIQRWVRYRCVLKPDAQEKKTYDAYYALYRKLYSDTVETVHQLVELTQK